MPRLSPAVAATVDAFEAHRDPERAGPMAAYMKLHFVFLGIPAPKRTQLERHAWRDVAKPVDESALMAEIDEFWGLPEREYQYAGLSRLGRNGRLLTARSLPVLERLILTKSWWDTVDALCRHPVGDIVRREPQYRQVMDDWLRSDEMWLQRSAILHMDAWRDDIDFDWLTKACVLHMHQTEFFIRKAIGWALRTYAHRSPANADRVRAFIAEHESELSGLSKREALKRVKH